jgi:hypothetical protein
MYHIRRRQGLPWWSSDKVIGFDEVQVAVAVVVALYTREKIADVFSDYANPNQ